MEKITYEEYQKKMDEIIEKDLPIEETFMLLIDEAAKYKLISNKNKTNDNKNKTTNY